MQNYFLSDRQLLHWQPIRHPDKPHDVPHGYRGIATRKFPAPEAPTFIINSCLAQKCTTLLKIRQHTKPVTTAASPSRSPDHLSLSTSLATSSAPPAAKCIACTISQRPLVSSSSQVSASTLAVPQRPCIRSDPCKRRPGGPW